MEFSDDGGVSLLRKFTVWDMTERFVGGFDNDVVFIAHFQMRAVMASTRVGLRTVSLAAVDFRDAILGPLKTNLRLANLALAPKSVGGMAIGIPSGGGSKDAWRNSPAAVSEPSAAADQLFIMTLMEDASTSLCEKLMPIAIPPHSNFVTCLFQPKLNQNFLNFIYMVKT